MALTVGEVVRGHQITTVRQDTLVRDAVTMMIDNDFSQLPVVDEQGRCIGLLTERKLTTAIMMGVGCHVVDAPVRQWMEQSVKIVNPNYSIYKAAQALTDTYAIVVGVDSRPIGIVTDYDIAAFLAEFSQGLAHVEDIEKRLRGYIERIFPTPESRTVALFKAFGAHRDNANEPARAYEELTLREQTQLILAKGNWPSFEPYFGSKATFQSLLNQAARIRNQIAHFRGKLTPGQLAQLEATRDFLHGCPRVQGQVGASGDAG